MWGFFLFFFWPAASDLGKVAAHLLFLWLGKKYTRTCTYNCARGRTPYIPTLHSHTLCKLRWYLLKEKQTLVLVFARLNSQLGEYLQTSKYLHCGVSDSFMDPYFFFFFFFLMATLTGEGNSGAWSRHAPNIQTKTTCYKCTLKVHHTGKAYI